MNIEEKIKRRNIGILGMARSGVAAALMAKEFGGYPFVSDSASGDKLVNQIDRLSRAEIPFETGGHSDKLLSCDYVVISPGIPLTAEIVKKIREKYIPVFSELEFASWACQGKMVAVTGSNGKTTTTTLIGEVFKAAGYETYVCGNIGHPFAEVASSVPQNGVAVVEVSTYQLESIENFKPHVAMVLNLTPDHLDRHGTFEEYKRMKFRITENQDSDDFFIVNHDDPETAAWDINTRASQSSFSIDAESDAVTWVEDDYLCARVEGKTTRVIKRSDMMIPGYHNLQNAAAAIASALPFGIKPETIAGVLKNFKGVEHRLENLGRVAGIEFINDSKATNVDSTVVALKAMTGPVHMIMGGLDKGSPYEPIIAVGKDKIRGLVVIGEARDKIFNELGKTFPTQFADSLEEAVNKSFEAAIPGETILLSPACASFDMFNSFEHRGQVYKEAVHALKKGKKENGTVTNH